MTVFATKFVPSCHCNGGVIVRSSEQSMQMTHGVLTVAISLYCAKCGLRYKGEEPQEEG